MNERLTTLGLAAAAFALFYLVFVPKPRPEHDGLGRPLSTDAGGAGYLGLRRWLETEKIPVEILTERYEHLEQTVPSTGNVLIMVMPLTTPARKDELARLDQWIRRGNTLLVSAALADTPAWSLGSSRVIESVREVTGLGFVEVKNRGRPQQPSLAITELVGGKRSLIVPNAPHPLLAGVKSVQVISELPAARWNGQASDYSMALELARISANGDPALWLRGRGAGQVIVLAAASPFSNAAIGQADNARLLGNMVAWSRRPGGAVWFDDAHQGALREYDPGAFFADSRLHWTLAWLVVLWVAFVIGVQPLRPRPREWNPIDITSFLAMSGEFLASAVTPRTAGLRLVRNFRDALGCPPDQRAGGELPWRWLSSQASVPPAVIAELETLHQRLLAGRRVDLVHLQSLLSRLQGTLA